MLYITCRYCPLPLLLFLSSPPCRTPPCPSFGLASAQVVSSRRALITARIYRFRSGFLADADYHHLTQCETLEDIKMNLQETDYDQFLANESTVTPSIILEKATKKMVTEFQYVRAQAVEPLSTFMDYITFEYMIDNVMLLLKGTISGRDVNELIEQCHPLGMFRDSTMRSIPIFENNSKGYADLYQTVLIDTPVGANNKKWRHDVVVDVG